MVLPVKMRQFWHWGLFAGELLAIIAQSNITARSRH
jgi:hypothetical protein